jgi:hypothetical protein
MKVIIAGSRTINAYELLVSVIDDSGYVITEVVSGTANGVDKLGEQWANDNNIPIKQFPANWREHGKAAGYIRNREMAEYADAAIILWDNISNGTQNMITEMRKKKKPIHLNHNKRITE